MAGYKIIDLEGNTANPLDGNVGCPTANGICPTLNIFCSDVDFFCDVDWGCGCGGEDDDLCACGRIRPI